MTARVIRARYYWPTLRENCTECIKKCKECQEFSSIHHAPPEVLHIITCPWPFAMQGMDILGPIPTMKSQIKFLLVAVDYFTKWVEVEPPTKIMTQKVQKFTWKNIICRYDLPQAIVTDNGRQFTEKGCEEFLKQLGIRHLNSSMESPNQWASRSHKQSHPCRVTQKTVEGSHGAVGRRAPEHA